MKLKLRLKEGRPFDPSLLDLDTDTLYQFFQDVRIEQTRVPGGIALTFTVSENPVVRELVIDGLEGLKREDIVGLPIRTRVGYPLVDRNLDLDREDIAALYRRRGWHFAHVGDPVLVEPTPDGGRRVVMTVVEGPQVKVDELVFSGNASIPRKTLVDAMLTKTSGLFSSSYFNEETLREDVVELRRVYRGEGFLDAEVVLSDLRFSDDRAKVVVEIAVVEGERYTVGDVTFKLERESSGPGAMPPEDAAFFTQEGLRGLLGLVPGEVYSGKVEEKGREAIKEAYFARSYLEARLDRADLRPRAGARVVDVFVPVVEGRKYRVARVQVVGNEFTRDKIVRREIRAVPGDAVDRNALDRALVRLRGLRFFERVSRRFEDVIGPDGKPIPDVKDVVYELVEAKTGKLTVGAALSGEGGLAGNFQFQKRNFDVARLPRSWDDLTSGRAFTGAGQNFNFYLQPGTQTSAFGLDFGEPRVFGTRLGLKLGGSKRLGFREGYTEDLLGYYVRLSHPVYERDDDRAYLEAFATWRQERRQIRDVSDNAVPGVFLFEGERELHSVQAGLAFRMVDDPLRPASKLSTSLAFEYAGGVLGGGLDYWKADFSHDQRWKLREDDEGRKSWLTLAVNAGVSHAFDETPEVPPYSRYYAGGRGTIRGFAFRGVGPHSNGRPMGGEFMVTGTVEYEQPVAEDFLSAVAFVDSGTLATTIADDMPLRLSVGAGIRLKIPGFGEAPLALDFAVPLLLGDEDQKTLISFSLARDF